MKKMTCPSDRLSERKCGTCGEIKSLDEFYRDAHGRDGMGYTCKPCDRADMAARMKKKYEDPEFVLIFRAKARERYHTRYKGNHNWKQSSPVPYREKYPERRSAGLEVKKALYHGILKNGKCEVCGSKKSEAHHDDYSKPLKVRWLCRKHHHEHHVKLREKELVNETN